MTKGYAKNQQQVASRFTRSFLNLDVQFFMTILPHLDRAQFEPKGSQGRFLKAHA